jgi:tetratricopeptide (TPR) repeat protein
MTDPLAEKIGINVQGGTVNVQNLNIGIAERLAESGDRVRILVVAANPLGSSPLKLDHEVKTIQEALRRSSKRDNFVVEYRLAATPSELRRALLDVEPHVLHFSGHGAGEQGLLFVSDESAGAIYRSDSGEVRSRSTDSNEIKFVPAQPLANLLQLCDEHLECVVLNACYSDVQGNAISANIPFTIGMRDQVADNVAIKFSQGFYDAIGSGKSYEKAFEWGKVAIEFDLVNNESAKILILRKKGENLQTSREYFNRGLAKNDLGDYQGAIADYNEAIRINPYYDEAFNGRGSARYSNDKEGAVLDFTKAIELNPSFALAYDNRGVTNSNLGKKQEALFDCNEAIRINPSYANFYYNRGNVLKDLGQKKEAIADYNEAIRINPNYADAYNNRGIEKSALGDKEGAISDYNEAIRLNPNLNHSYYNRGLIKKERGEKQEALADFRKASELYQQQGNTEWYNNSRNMIRELEGR